MTSQNEKHKLPITVVAIVPAILLLIIAFIGVSSNLTKQPKKQDSLAEQAEYRILTDNHSIIEYRKGFLEWQNGDPIDEKGYLGATIERGGFSNSFVLFPETVSKLGLSIDMSNNEIVTGDKIIYYDKDMGELTVISEQELRDKQDKKEVCYSADEAWDNIGKDACVAFVPIQFSFNNGIMFLSEKTDYREGFQIVIKGNFTDKETVKDEYLNKVTIFADGQIERYEGHPEIVVWNSRNIGEANVVGYSSKYGMIYSR